jgi:signal transduction histidine kinase
MQERANLVGGDLQIDSSVGVGTEVRIAIPLDTLAKIEQPERQRGLAGVGADER